MTAFLVIGGIGIALLIAALAAGDLLDGVLEGLDAGEWFTGAGLAGFLGALGFGGALVLSITGNMIAAVAGGVLAGAALAWAVAWTTLRLRTSGSGSAPTRASLIGRVAVVVSAIPAGGYGEIRITDDGHLTKLHARADQPLAEGTEVWIVESLSPTSVFVRVAHP